MRACSRRFLLPAALLPLLGGCNFVVLDPAGDVARQQGNLIIYSTGLMLLIIVPVIALTLFFAWRYRAQNTQAKYEPNWDHSTQLELVIWAAPLLIIICLGALTWVGTHLLDPYRPLTQAKSASGPKTAATKPLEVDVVALDWKWLFVYPEQGVATVNELVLPVNRPVTFRISASSVMNSFYVPALAGQIYAMPGMETKLHGQFDRTGDFTGFSANYSGAGFSNMRFAARSVTAADFDSWVAKARASAATLDRATYLKLERPSEKDPVRRFAQVVPGLFDAVVNKCVDPGKMCMNQMMAIDADGGTGNTGIYNTRELSYDKFAARGTQVAPAHGSAGPMTRRYLAANCAKPMAPIHAAEAALVDPSPLMGAGLARPGGPVAPPGLRTRISVASDGNSWRDPS